MRSFVAENHRKRKPLVCLGVPHVERTPERQWLQHLIIAALSKHTLTS